MTHLLVMRAQLLAASAAPDAPGTALFATLLAAHSDPSVLGLSPKQFALLYARHFDLMQPARAGLAIHSEEQAGFVSALVAFLLSHVRANSADDMADADCLDPRPCVLAAGPSVARPRTKRARRSH
jgi:nitrogen fixation protein NifQ